MQNRERGAAHINIYYFLVLLIMFLGALWFGYVQLTQNNDRLRAAEKARKSEEEKKLQITQYQQYVEEIRNILGETGQYAGKPGFNWPKDKDGKSLQPKPIAKATLPMQVNRAIKDFTDGVGIPGTVANPIGSLFGVVRTRFDALTQEKQTAEKKRQEAITGLTAAEGTFATTTQGLNNTISRNAKDNANQRQVMEQENQRLVRLNSDKINEIRSRDDEISRLNTEHAAAVSRLEKKINLLQLVVENHASKIRLINPPDTPDGAVISASMTASVAFIDIGRKDMLPRGTVFRISSPTLKNKAHQKTKAYCTVMEVKQDRAKVRLWGVTDRYDPVVRGDVITNELYTPHLKRNIALIGRFSYPYPKPEVKRLLERLGNTVMDKVNVATDLVIVGSGTINEEGTGLTAIAETEEYKFAENHRIEIITLTKVRDLLRLGN